MAFDEHDERARKILLEERRQEREKIPGTLQGLIAAEFRKDAEIIRSLEKQCNAAQNN